MSITQGMTTSASGSNAGDRVPATIQRDLPRKSLRVAAIIDTNILSGPGRQLAALAGALRLRNVDLLVVTFQRHGTPLSPFVAHLARQGVPCVVVPQSGRTDLRVVHRVRALLREWSPEVVQTHSYKATAIALLLRLGGAPWKWIGFSHGGTTEDRKARFYHWLDRRMIRRADRVVVVAASQLESFKELGPRVQLVDNAVVPLPPSDSSQPPLDASLSRSTRPVLGVVGRLSSEKGVDVFLHACDLLRRQGTSFSAFIAGDGPERTELEALRDRLGLAARVRFLGSVADVRTLYEAMDLLVLPSRSEGLPNVLLEALAADRPVVATRVGAIPDVVSEPLVGTLADAESVDGLATAIVSALKLGADPAAAAARRQVVARYSLDRRVATHLALYESVCTR
jgi:glycosyltransferase involved in cell wall biosynthesis